jgi:cation diffusion facilitator family transporter
MQVFSKGQRLNGKSSMNRMTRVRKVLFITLALNISVASAKIAYGYIIGSISMLSDGFHSFFDGTSNVIGLVGIWIAAHPPDETHPYGHRKFETLSTIAIAVLIFGAGIEILRRAYERLSNPNHIEVTLISFLVMGITLSVNVWVMLYESRKGKELKSDFLQADALHTQTDIYISLSVVISLVAAKAGYYIVDVIAAFIITIFIAKMGFSILKSAADVLTDAACMDTADIRKVVMGIKGVKECHGIRTRGRVDHVNIDLHVMVDPDIKTEESHEIAHDVEDMVKREFPEIKDVVIHIEPYRRRK